MRNRLFIIYLFVIMSAGSLSAVTVNVDFGNAALNAALKTDVEDAIRTEIAKYDYMPKLATGFGNANTYASHAATLRGYQGYDIFAIAVGSMLSVQAPNDDPMFFTELQDELDTGDLYAGVGGNPAVVQAGLNLGFILDGLHIAFKFGKFDYGVENSDFKVDYKSNLFGGLLNYQLINEKAILSRILLWRGLSLESGCIYSNNIVSFYKELPSQDITNGGYTVRVDKSVDLVLDTKSVVVPIEIYTSIRLLYVLNIGVGGGVDYVPYGNTSFKLKSAGPIEVIADIPTAGLLIGTKGSATINAGTDDVAPDKYRPKAMMNLGISAGPIFIDVPATYYFTDNGYAVGLSAGMAW
ncbi:MAG: hypothetical protein CVV49_11565 [Spirochaetae bacterium HGW-Spirochaetae-5]|nr:MAG: hypothetical protein CVV49_11565 [Spirochaetae bacterium HGW-Spirochaetae-5]